MTDSLTLMQGCNTVRHLGRDCATNLADLWGEVSGLEIGASTVDW